MKWPARRLWSAAPLGLALLALGLRVSAPKSSHVDGAREPDRRRGGESGEGGAARHVHPLPS